MFLAKKLNNGAGSPAAPVDAQFNYVTMLLHGDGTNGAQNNTFLDSSASPLTITRNGNTTQGSFSPYGSNWSNFFDGSGDYLTCSVSVPATGAFTVEMFVFPTSTAGYQLLFSQFTSGNAGSLQILWDDTTDKFTVNIGASTVLTSSSTYALNTWHHLAITRDGSNNMTMWVNGASAATATNSTSILQTTTYISSRSALDGYFNGYISNLRVTNTAVYTTSFTPSTTPLTAISGTQLLTCADNRFIDDSASPKTITVNGNTSVQRFNPFGTSTAYSTSVIGGSGYFDGSGDNLVTSGAGSFNPRSTFTVEFWTYPITNDTVTWINSNTNDNFYIETFSGTLYVGDGSINTISTTPPALNRWTHVLLSFDGTTYRLFYNGVSQATSTTLLASITLTAFRVGQKNDTSRPFSGYINDMRVLVGTALYTSAFTPPTAPLASISNTVLLLSYTNGAIFDNAMMNNLETVGNAQISTSVKKYGTGSLYFDGTGDYLKAPNSELYTFGTGDFTVEFWVYMTVSANNAMIGKGGINWGGADVQGWSINYSDGSIVSSGMQAVVRGGSTQASINFGALSTNTWTHIAVTRSSGTLRGFVGGVLGSSQSNSNDPTNTRALNIGADFNNAFPFTGYIDDLRITKGYARYTATFTPPTSALSDTGPI